MARKNQIRAGVIDIGTNSIKLIVGEKGNGHINVLDSLKNFVPFAQYTFLKGRISQEMIDQTIGVLDKYNRVLKDYDVQNVRVIATTAVREAKNRDIFLDTIRRKTGFKIEILNVGDVIFYLDGYLSQLLESRFPLHDKKVLTAELGSGSLDVSLMNRGATQMNLGLPIGTMRLKQMAAALDGSMAQTQEALQQLIANEVNYLRRNLPPESYDDIILIDENYSYYIQNVLPDKQVESTFFTLNAEEIKAIISKIADRNYEDIAASLEIPIETAEVFHEYALILQGLISLSKSGQVYIAETSLSEAILGSMLFKIEMARTYNSRNQLISMSKFLCQKFNMDMEHTVYVAKLSKTLFDSLKKLLGLKNKHSIYLEIAAYLRDLGMFIHNRAHHKHTEYIVGSLSLFRLTDEEMKIIACIARYHRKAPPLARHLLYGALPLDKQILVQKLSSILRIANALDCSHLQKVSKFKVQISKNQDVTITARTSKNFLLEKAAFSDKKDLFEEITGSKINLLVKR